MIILFHKLGKQISQVLLNYMNQTINVRLSSVFSFRVNINESAYLKQLWFAVGTIKYVTN